MRRRKRKIVPNKSIFGGNFVSNHNVALRERILQEKKGGAIEENESNSSDENDIVDSSILLENEEKEEGDSEADLDPKFNYQAAITSPPPPPKGPTRHVAKPTYSFSQENYEKDQGDREADLATQQPYCQASPPPKKPKLLSSSEMKVKRNRLASDGMTHKDRIKLRPITKQEFQKSEEEDKENDPQMNPDIEKPALDKQEEEDQENVPKTPRDDKFGSDIFSELPSNLKFLEEFGHAAYTPEQGVTRARKPDPKKNPAMKEHCAALPTPNDLILYGSLPQEHLFNVAESNRIVLGNRRNFPGHTLARHKKPTIKEIPLCPDPEEYLSKKGYLAKKLEDVPYKKVPTQEINSLEDLKEGTVTEDVIGDVFKKKPKLVQEYVKEQEVVMTRLSGQFHQISRADLPTGRLCCSLCLAILSYKCLPKGMEDDVGRPLCRFCLAKLKEIVEMDIEPTHDQEIDCCIRTRECMRGVKSDPPEIVHFSQKVWRAPGDDNFKENRPLNFQMLSKHMGDAQPRHEVIIEKDGSVAKPLTNHTPRKGENFKHDPHNRFETFDNPNQRTKEGNVRYKKAFIAHEGTLFKFPNDDTHQCKRCLLTLVAEACVTPFVKLDKDEDDELKPNFWLQTMINKGKNSWICKFSKENCIVEDAFLSQVKTSQDSLLKKINLLLLVSSWKRIENPNHFAEFCDKAHDDLQHRMYGFPEEVEDRKVSFCPYCLYDLEGLDLDQHLERAHLDKTFVCSYCKQDFDAYEDANLEYHLENEHPSLTKPRPRPVYSFKCSVCNNYLHLKWPMAKSAKEREDFVKRCENHRKFCLVNSLQNLKL